MLSSIGLWKLGAAFSALVHARPSILMLLLHLADVALTALS